MKLIERKNGVGNIVLNHISSVSRGVANHFSNNFLSVSLEVEIVNVRLLKVNAKYEYSILNFIECIHGYQ